MKDKLTFYLFTVAAMLGIPALSLLSPPNIPVDKPTLSESSAETTAVSTEMTTTKPNAAVQNVSAGYRVLDVATGEVLDVPLRDYLIGAVCAEMPPSYETEALKAQAVAIHSYAERIAERSRQFPDSALHGADFSNDTALYQGYHTEAVLRELFGDAYEACYAKVAAAVDAVADEMLCYDGAPIIAAFHAISTGKTESAENVWGEPLAYLCSVDSAYDAAAPQYKTTAVFSKEQVREKLLARMETLPEDSTAWLKVTEVTDAGNVVSVQCGEKRFSGQEVREMFALRSACFEVCVNEKGEYEFTVKGFGHDVGMSQFGANEMAKNGSTYKEILRHYYPAAELMKI